MTPEEIDNPWYRRKSTITFAATLFLALPSLVEQLAPWLTDEQRAKAASLAAVAAAVTALYARMGGVEAAKRAATMGPAPATDGDAA